MNQSNLTMGVKSAPCLSGDDGFFGFVEDLPAVLEVRLVLRQLRVVRHHAHAVRAVLHAPRAVPRHRASRPAAAAAAATDASVGMLELGGRRIGSVSRRDWRLRCSAGAAGHCRGGDATRSPLRQRRARVCGRDAGNRTSDRVRHALCTLSLSWNNQQQRGDWTGIAKKVFLVFRLSLFLEKLCATRATS